MVTDWELTGTSPWVLQTEGGAVIVGDTATIIYVRNHSYTRVVHTTGLDGKYLVGPDGNRFEAEETKEEPETQQVKHQRTSFGGEPQTDPEWHANIGREIAADLSDLNKESENKVDITATVIG